MGGVGIGSAIQPTARKSMQRTIWRTIPSDFAHSKTIRLRFFAQKRNQNTVSLRMRLNLKSLASWGNWLRKMRKSRLPRSLMRGDM